MSAGQKIGSKEYNLSEESEVSQHPEEGREEQAHGTCDPRGRARPTRWKSPRR